MMKAGYTRKWKSFCVVTWGKRRTSSGWHREKGIETFVLALQSAVCVLFLLLVLGGRTLELGGNFQLWNLCNYVGSSGQVVSGLWEVPQRKMNEAYVEGPADHVFSYLVCVHPLAGNPVSDGCRVYHLKNGYHLKNLGGFYFLWIKRILKGRQEV